MVGTDFSPASIQGQRYCFNGVYQIEILYELRICAPSLRINKHFRICPPIPRLCSQS